ncbi:MAG: chloride channel protein [Deltaproteobacteria bacterium]|nr:chloride channel protein [Deltaproteobacteria bacterium]
MPFYRLYSGLMKMLVGKSPRLVGKKSRLIVYCVFVGVIAGLGAAGFLYVLSWANVFFMKIIAGYEILEPPGEQILHVHFQTSPRPWLLFLVPAIGGLLSGFLVYTFAPEAEGHGTDAMIDAFHNKEGLIRGRVPIVKGLASILTLASGGSAGREGPIAQIGAGFGSWIGQILKLDVRERRLLLLAGTAGGLGAVFRAPLGGALTSIEVLYKEDFETEGAVTSIIAAVVAYAVFILIFGSRPIFDTPDFKFTNPMELLFYSALGLICSPLGLIYSKLFYGSRDRIFRRLPIKKHYIPALGGLGVGLIGLFLPQVMGSGWGVIQEAIWGHLPLSLMIAAIFFKMVTTSLTISSGGSGGVFGPTLFIGGMIGGVVGHLGHLYAPHIVTQPAAYVLVGMAAFFAGVANAPLAAILMVSEMSGSYGLLAPLMLVSVIAILLSSRWSIYEKQVKNKFHSPAHQADMTVNILEEIKVGRIFHPQDDVVTLPAGMKLKEIKELLTQTRQVYFPVKDLKGRYFGILNMHDIRMVLFDENVADLVVAGELVGPMAFVRPEDSLFAALSRFTDTGYGQIPVIMNYKGRDIICGLLTHEDVIKAYQEEVARRRET